MKPSGRPKRFMKKIDKKGFSYFVDIEAIKNYMKIPPSSKLEWLEEANRFTRMALSKRRLMIWEKFRRGEI